MKSLLVTALSFLSLSAIACPNIEGKFNCMAEGESWLVDVSQEKSNDVTTYVIDGTAIIADGAEHDMNEQDFVGTYNASCAPTTVTVTQKGQITDGGEKGDLNMVTTISVTAAGFDTLSKGTITFGGTNYPIDQIGNCVRQ